MSKWCLLPAQETGVLPQQAQIMGGLKSLQDVKKDFKHAIQLPQYMI